MRKLISDAPKYVLSAKFKETVPATKRENLMRIIKRQSKQIEYERKMQEEGLEEGQEMPRMTSADPPVVRKDLLVPEKDYEFDSSMRFRRKT